MEKFFLGCDWGTSSFRLRLFDLSADGVVDEVVSNDGIASMHRNWQERGAIKDGMEKGEFFRKYLQSQIKILSTRLSLSLDGITLLISGMASSSIGLEDLPYASIPFAVDGSEAVLKRLVPQSCFPHEIVLVSGVRSEKDVMRGEETQLIGLLRLLAQTGSKLDEGLLIFPGTHSKHIYLSKGRVAKFKTFMTGELFSVLSKNSILKDSIQNGDIREPSNEDADALKAGVKESAATGILNGLFTVRTNQLFGRWEKTQNAFYLSGLLIGEELNYLLKNELPLILCSGKNLYRYYQLALDELNLSCRTTIVPFELVDMAAVAGQHVIFEKHIKQF